MSWVTNLVSGFVLSMKKYPLAMIGFILLAILGIYENHIDFWSNNISINDWDLISKTAISSISMILPIIVSTYIYGIWSNKNSNTYILQIIAIILWTIDFVYFYKLWIDNLDLNQIIYQRIFFGISFLSLFCVYYKNERNDIKLRFVDSQIISSILISLFFVLVINLWIAGIFWSLDYLFDINVNWNYYRDIVIFVSSVIWGSLFVNHISDIQNANQDYKKIVYIFAKYVLLGLLWIYTVIFLAYGVKILATWTWPKWQLVYMTIGYFVLWILANVLLYPVSSIEKWIKYIYNGFYTVSIVILFMGFMAIYLRLADYGWTINRYFVVLILVFCALFCLYNILFRDKKIVWLVCMAIFALWFSALPMVWFDDVSYNSQVNRFDNLISKSNSLWTDAKIKNNYLWTWESAANVYDQIDYLSNYKNIEYLKSYISDIDYSKLSAELATGYSYDHAEKIRSYIMNGYQYDYNYSDNYKDYPNANNCNTVYIYKKDIPSDYDIEGYQKMININYYNLSKTINVTNGWFSYNYNNKKIDVDLNKFIKDKYNSWCMTNDISWPVTGSDYILYIQSLNADYDSWNIKITDLQGYLFVK